MLKSNEHPLGVGSAKERVLVTVVFGVASWSLIQRNSLRIIFLIVQCSMEIAERTLVKNS